MLCANYAWQGQLCMSRPTVHAMVRPTNYAAVVRRAACGDLERLDTAASASSAFSARARWVASCDRRVTSNGTQERPFSAAHTAASASSTSSIASRARWIASRASA